MVPVTGFLPGPTCDGKKLVHLKAGEVFPVIYYHFV